MRINTLMCMGLPVWPPQWALNSKSLSDKAILRDVKVIVATSLLRIDVEHNMIPDLGMLMVEPADREPLYLILKENIGKSLAEIGELEIDSEQDREEGPILATMGS